MTNKDTVRVRLLNELEVGSSPSVLEIGVWKGEFSEVLLHTLKPTLLVLVDPWLVREDYEDAWYGPKLPKKEMESNYLGVVSKFAYYPEVIVVRTASENLPTLYSPQTFDVIYIDGDHTADGFKADLALATTLCKGGGYIICDDYGLTGWWDGAITTVLDGLENDKLIHLKAEGTQYVLQRAILPNC